MFEKMTRARSRKLALIDGSLSSQENQCSTSTSGNASLQASDISRNRLDAEGVYHGPDCPYWKLLGNHDLLLKDDEVAYELLLHYQEKYPVLDEISRKKYVKSDLEPSSHVGYYLQQQRKMFDDILQEYLRKCSCRQRTRERISDGDSSADSTATTVIIEDTNEEEEMPLATRSDSEKVQKETNDDFDMEY